MKKKKHLKHIKKKRENLQSNFSPTPRTSCTLRVIIWWTSYSSSFSFAIFRWVRVSWYSFFVFCMNVSLKQKEGRRGKTLKPANARKIDNREYSKNMKEKRIVGCTKFYECVRSSSSFNLTPINALKLILKVFQVLKGKFLGIRTITHGQITNTSFNNITKVLS